MYRRLRWLGLVLLVIMLAGCGGEKETTTTPEVEETGVQQEEQNKKEEAEEQKENGEDEASASNKLIEAAKKANTVNPEIKFREINWMMGAPKRQPTGGIWIFSGENHPQEISNSFNWETKDVLLIQISNEEYKGYGLDIRSLQILNDEVINVLVELSAPDDEKELAPRRYIEVDKGALDGKLLVISTHDGEILETE
ncbi:hypothetical protein [Caldalkalibacillus mannanilyticus]|uniref:hypothetical protein n=1 Tax=Caldalkalibacillus mannanilyticus TaxID=1418 RepID=UPI00046AFF39|nr:hypothetical protein [Caldalkalibacillus mannanilyticus]